MRYVAMKRDCNEAGGDIMHGACGRGEFSFLPGESIFLGSHVKCLCKNTRGFELSLNIAYVFLSFLPLVLVCITQML